MVIFRAVSISTVNFPLFFHPSIGNGSLSYPISKFKAGVKNRLIILVFSSIDRFLDLATAKEENNKSIDTSLTRKPHEIRHSFSISRVLSMTLVVGAGIKTRIIVREFVAIVLRLIFFSPHFMTSDSFMIHVKNPFIESLTHQFLSSSRIVVTNSDWIGLITSFSEVHPILFFIIYLFQTTEIKILFREYLYSPRTDRIFRVCVSSSFFFSFYKDSSFFSCILAAATDKVAVFFRSTLLFVLRL